MKMSRRAAASPIELIRRGKMAKFYHKSCNRTDSFSISCSNFHENRPYSPKPSIDFSRVNELDDALSLFQQMVRMRPQPSVRAYNKLLSVIAKMNRYTVALNVFDEMRQAGCPVNEFYLDPRTGKNCFLIGAWSLSLGTMASAWINNFHPQSRFSDAAELTESRHLFIEGNIKTKMMSPETSYAAYLVYGFADMYANLRSAVSIIRKNSYHESSGDDYGDEQAKIVRFQEGDGREDGWMEIQLGEFYVDFGEDGELQVQLLDTSGNSKNGLIVEGIEFRPFDTTKT